MKIIILEGIATSGKTSIKKSLKKAFLQKGKKCYAIGEDKTLMPLMDNDDKLISIDFLQRLIGKSLTGKKDYIIFDRLYFTHIIKTNSTIKDFKAVEDLIKSFSMIVLLKVDETLIGERIKFSRKLREPSWSEYVDRKGNDEEINGYYAKQQKLLLELIAKTSLKHKIYDSSNNDFEDIAEDIIKSLND